jgi:hypothetical protein
MYTIYDEDEGKYMKVEEPDASLTYNSINVNEIFTS